MTHKFKIGDVITRKNNTESQREIVDITGNSEKWIKGDWISGPKELLVRTNCYVIIEIIGKSEKSIKGNWRGDVKKVSVPKNSYVLKNLETNKLYWDYFKETDKNYQLIQQDKNEPLKWKNYEEILV